MNLRYEKHRNSQKRIYFKDACYFITSNTFNWYPFFKEPIFCPPVPNGYVRAGELFMENLRLCKRLKGFLLYGWFLGYDHFHLQIQPCDKWNISDVMQFLKRHVSRNLNIVMGHTMGMFESNDDDYPPIEGDIGQCRLQMFGILRHNHHWPHIQKFDQYVQKLKNQFQQKYSNKHPFPKFQWKRSFHDHYIRNENDFDYHMEYIAYNPTKHKMPDDWGYVFLKPEYDDLMDEC